VLLLLIHTGLLYKNRWEFDRIQMIIESRALKFSQALRLATALLFTSE